MNLYLVTLKLPKNPEHNPRNKQTGVCPVGNGGQCTDVTGEHHTVIVYAQSIEGARANYPTLHITRIEEVRL